MRICILFTCLLCLSLQVRSQDSQKMAHLNADLVVTAFPEWVGALKETAEKDMKQQQALAQCMADFETVKNQFAATDFSSYSQAQKDSVFKLHVFAKGQECEKIRGGLLQNSNDNIPENVKLFQQVMDKVLVHFKATGGYDNIYPMATSDIQKPEIQESIKHYKSKDITEVFIKTMKAHITKNKGVKAAASKDIEP